LKNTGRQKIGDSRERAVEVGGALRLRVEAEDRRNKIEEGMMEYWNNGMLENEETVDSIQKTE